MIPTQASHKRGRSSAPSDDKPQKRHAQGWRAGRAANRGARSPSSGIGRVRKAVFQRGGARFFRFFFSLRGVLGWRGRFGWCGRPPRSGAMDGAAETVGCLLRKGGAAAARFGGRALLVGWLWRRTVERLTGRGLVTVAAWRWTIGMERCRRECDRRCVVTSGHSTGILLESVYSPAYGKGMLRSV